MKPTLHGKSLRLTAYCLLITVYALLAPRPATAQTASSSYWQHTIRLSHLKTADVNHDGLDEFVVADETGTVELLASNGRVQWEFNANSPIFALNTVNTNGPDHPQLEIVLATATHLILLAPDGRLLWQVPITTIATPSTLLTRGSLAEQADWLAQYQSNPVDIVPFNVEPDGRQEILLLLASSQLQRYDAEGVLRWRYSQNSNPNINTQPKVVVGDLDQDGQDEIVMGRSFGERGYSQLVLIDDDVTVWDPPIQGRFITALALVSFNNDELPYIAVGNNQGRVFLFDKDRHQHWLRTLNRQITSLTAVTLPTGPALAVGTAVGRVVTYNAKGIRQWTSQLAPESNRPVLALSASPFTPTPEQPIEPGLAAVLGPPPNINEPSDVMLLSSSNGGILKTITAVDGTGLSQLSDINRDQKAELILAGSSTLDLLGLGIGANKNAADWNYTNVGPSPNDYLVIDLDQDGEDELLVGGSDGRLHYIENNGSPQWITPAGGSITHLEALNSTPGEVPTIIVVHSHATADPGGDTVDSSSLELKNANGEQVWRQIIDSPVTSLLVVDVNNDGHVSILIGTEAGDVQAYDADGEQQWRVNIGSAIQQFVLLDGNELHGVELTAVTATQLIRIQFLNDDTILHHPIATYPQPIRRLYTLNQPGGELATSLLALVTDGNLYGHNWRGIQLPQWPTTIGGSPTVSLPAREIIEEAFLKEVFEIDNNESLLIATDEAQLLRLDIKDNRPSISWRLSDMGQITTLYWGDLDGDTLPDMAVGNAAGRIRLLTSDLDPVGEDLQLLAPISALTVLKNNQQADLLAMTRDGHIQLFRGQEDRPPLLTNPITEVGVNQYTFNVAVQNVDNAATVQLEIWHPAVEKWQPVGGAQTLEGEGPLFWTAVSLPPNLDRVHYRFFYSDGSHEGYVTPHPGPRPMIAGSTSEINRVGLSLLGLAGLTVFIIVGWQSQTPAARAQRIYRRFRHTPSQTLRLLENRYTYTDGSPDFLLNLANLSRQRGDLVLAGLVDGLYLLADQPDAGLAIMVNVLAEVNNVEPRWDDFERWQITYSTGRALLEAPSITELSLLRPRLVELLAFLEERQQWSPILDALLPILTNLRDSERVDLTEDRLIYLNEAAVSLRQLQLHLTEFSSRIEKTLVRAIMRRWMGLVSAEIEELRGRAELMVALKTKRLVPGRTEVVLQVQNNGRAAAENIIAVLDEDPAYVSFSDPQIVPTLPPGRSRQISFTIEPKVSDRFRIALTLTYDDRNQQDKVFAFGDMVHLLKPTREFKPIHNPYMPGTPLRRNSPIFVGRQHLFDFIAENAGRVAQRNVLILIGQRRTGKTSVLLRLEQQLPSHLLPVYIDCQSLGIMPGMPALLHDLAWLVADALANREIEVDVPEPAAWQDDPTGLFQRRFLPKVRQLLPSDTTLMLVFDEFEAIEQLVQDKILPPTIFPYLRHLMQHSEGLSFVFVGTRRLEEMSADYWSVLFNIALYHKIGYLSDESATKLITEPVAPDLVYDDLALDKILRVTAGHPYFLQLVCYTLIKRANAQRMGYVTISDVNAALDEMLRLGEVHFAYLWQRSSYVERALVTAVAHLLDPDRPFHAADVVQHLESYNVHLDPHEVTLALNQLVEREIMQEMTEHGTTMMYQLKIGLVGLWVAKNKSLSKLYAGGEGVGK